MKCWKQLYISGNRLARTFYICIISLLKSLWQYIEITIVKFPFLSSGLIIPACIHLCKCWLLLWNFWTQYCIFFSEIFLHDILVFIFTERKVYWKKIPQIQNNCHWTDLFQYQLCSLRYVYLGLQLRLIILASLFLCYHGQCQVFMKRFRTMKYWPFWYFLHISRQTDKELYRNTW